MNIDYNDQRFQQVNAEKQNALNEVNNTYNNMINNSDKYYNDLRNEAERYGKEQQELQQQKTDFAIEKLEQQKDWTKQDYTKEQKAAYQDYVKESNKYGANAQQMAQAGLLGTGYAESSKVSMYNAYQNRVATARESYNRAVIEYDNAIKDAQLANNATLAELAHNTLQTKLELALQGFQYKNDLLQKQIAYRNETEDRYYNRWKDVLSQINTEKAFEYQKERDRIADEQWQKQYNLSKSKASSGSSKSVNLTGSSLTDGNGNNVGFEDTGAVLSGRPVLKGSDGNYYYEYDGSYKQIPKTNKITSSGKDVGIYSDSKSAITLSDGTVLTKVKK